MINGYFFIHIEAYCYCCDGARLCLHGTGPLAGRLFVGQMMYEQTWGSDGMILTGENRRNRRKPIPFPLFLTNHMWVDMSANSGLRVEKLVINRLSCDTASLGPCQQNGCFGNAAVLFNVLCYTCGTQKFTFLSVCQSVFRAHFIHPKGSFQFKQ